MFTVPVGLMECDYRPFGANEVCLPSLRAEGLMKCDYRPCGDNEV